MTSSTKSIGIFDSGVGGLTVTKQIIESFPDESIVYFADTARIPYGDKSRETIVRYAKEITQFLLQKNIKILVIACNTASALALDQLTIDIPVIGVIEPGAKRAVEVSRNQIIAVLGTRGTIQSGEYQRIIQQRLPLATVHAIACPLFVPLVEEDFIDHPATRLIVKKYLEPLKKEKVDTLLLGCTHYPFLKRVIQEEMGPDVTIVDSASACAHEVGFTLKKFQLEVSNLGCRSHHYYVSDDPEKFQRLGEKLMGQKIVVTRYIP